MLLQEWLHDVYGEGESGLDRWLRDAPLDVDDMPALDFDLLTDSESRLLFFRDTAGMRNAWVG